MHPNTSIREDLEYAVSKGWRVANAGPRAHIWGTIYCHESSRDGCRFRVEKAGFEVARVEIGAREIGVLEVS